MTDTTIAGIRITILRVPWPAGPWLRGHAFGKARNFLVLEVETAGGIVGMGYPTAPSRPGHGLAFKREILRDCAVR